MAEFHELRKSRTRVEDIGAEAAIGKRSIQQAQRMLISKMDTVLAELEGELARVGALIELVHDPKIAVRLGEEQMRLGNAVYEVKRRLQNFIRGHSA